MRGYFSALAEIKKVRSSRNCTLNLAVPVWPIPPVSHGYPVAC